jgi:hypothetical protein
MPGFNIGEIIKAIVGGGGPDAMKAAMAGAPPVGAVPTGGAPPAAPPATPAAYNSPPDLVAMYTKLMEQSKRTEAFQRGATMIAAGLSPYQDNRDALLATIGKGGSGSGTGGVSIDNLIALQKLQQEQGDRAARAAQLPALGKQYNLDPATLEYLDRTGGLDTVIQEMAKPHTQVVQSGRQGQMLIDTRDGHLIQQLSPDNPPDTEFIEVGDGNHILVDKATKVPVGSKTGTPIVFTGPTLAEKKLQLDIKNAPADQALKERAQKVSEGGLSVQEGELKIKQDEAAAKTASKKIREQYLPLIQKQFGITEAAATYLNETDALDEFVKEASKPNNEVVTAADGTQMLIDKNTGALVKTLSPKKVPDTEYVEQGDGSKVLVEKDTGKRVDNGQILAKTAPKDELAAVKAAVEAINADEEKRGVPKDKQTTVGQYVKKHGTGAGVSVTVDNSGQAIPKAPDDWEYVTNEYGEAERDDNGNLRIRKIGGATGPAALDEAKTKAETAKTAADTLAVQQKTSDDEVKAALAESKKENTGVNKRVKFRIINRAVDDAIRTIDENKHSWLGVTGWGAALNWKPGGSQRTLANNLGVINSSTSIESLNEMRQASDTGGALGNVTDSDALLLKRALGSLDQWDNDQILRRNLVQYKAARDLMVNGIYDPKSPDAKSNGYRVPTYDEIDAAMEAAASDTGEPAGTYKGLKVREVKPGEK